jgi:hypothetical protein
MSAALNVNKAVRFATAADACRTSIAQAQERGAADCTVIKIPTSAD